MAVPAPSPPSVQRERYTAATGRKPRPTGKSSRVKAVGEAAFGQRADANTVVLHLPVPVSVNAIYSPRKGGGLRLSDAYSTWIQDAGWRLIQQRPGRIAGRYHLTVRIPDECGADLDNLIKATSDLLQLHGVVRNDRFADRIVLEWHSLHSEAVVELQPAEVA